MSELISSIGNVVRRRRKAAKLNQSECGVSYPTLSDLELGKNGDLKLSTLEVISRALKTTPWQILQDAERDFQKCKNKRNKEVEKA